MELMDRVKHWLRQITEVGLLLVALFIVIQLLFGTQWLAAANVVQNLIDLIRALGDNGVVGLIAIAIILWLFSKRQPG
jgi:TRAP-type C4-dicarboxylate transport system permease large subunit